MILAGLLLKSSLCIHLPVMARGLHVHVRSLEPICAWHMQPAVDPRLPLPLHHRTHSIEGSPDDPLSPRTRAEEAKATTLFEAPAHNPLLYLPSAGKRSGPPSYPLPCMGLRCITYQCHECGHRKEDGVLSGCNDYDGVNTSQSAAIIFWT